jgi:hypothetical protein
MSLRSGAKTAVVVLSALVSASVEAQSGPLPAADVPATAAPVVRTFIREPGRAEATRTERAIRLDGKLDDAAWQSARYVSGLTQREPAEGQAATDSTHVTFVYDQQALYIGARMFSSHPESIAAGGASRQGGSASSSLCPSTRSVTAHGVYVSVTSGGVRRLLPWQRFRELARPHL